MNEQPKSELLSRNVLILLLVVCLGAIAAVVVLVLKPGEREPEKIITVIETAAPEEAGVNVLQVEDAIANRQAVAVEGRRYKVRIDDNAREGAAGVAHIGGLVTFVPDTRKGDVVIVEVTELRRTTANAVVIEKLEEGAATETSAPPPRTERPPRRETAPSEMVGQIYRGTVESVGAKGDGVVKVGGKVVFVPGTTEGQHVEFQVVEDAGRFATAELIGTSPEPYPDAAPTAAPSGEQAQPARDRDDKPVVLGGEYEVTVSEPDRTNPDMNGVARIDNFVVFVPDTRPGDRVRIRITELRRRSASSEVIERLEPEPAAP